MPCHYDAPDFERIANNTQNELDDLTKKLCVLCRIVEKANPDLLKVDRQIYQWWIEHKKFDAKEGRL